MKTLLDTNTDAALVERMAARDERALGDLYDRHSRLLFGLALPALFAHRRWVWQDVNVALCIWGIATIDPSALTFGARIAWSGWRQPG